MFYHKSRNIRPVIHGDAFIVLGHEEELDWFRERIEEKYEVKFRARLGPDPGDDHSVRILNRIVSWNSEKGMEDEPYQGHAKIIIKHLGLREE